MSDAWIFLSIGDAGGGEKWVRLPELIAAADMNNHAIPTAAELTQAVSNLVAAGLADTYATDTRLTSAGREEYERTRSRSGGHVGGMFALDTAWRSRRFPDSSSTSWEVTEAEVHDAYEAYLWKHWRSEALRRGITRQQTSDDE